MRTLNMYSQVRSKSSAKWTKPEERVPPSSPMSNKTSQCRSLDAVNLLPRSHTSFFYYSSLQSEIHSLPITSSQSSCYLPSSPDNSRLLLRSTWKDTNLDDKKRITFPFSDKMFRAHLLSQTESLSFQPHTPTLSVVTFSCKADEISSRTPEELHKKANVEENASPEANSLSKSKFQKKKPENATVAKYIKSLSAETKSCIGPVASIRSLPSQSPTISLIAFSLSTLKDSMNQISVDMENKKSSPHTNAEELLSSSDEERPSVRQKKTFETVSTETYIGDNDPSENNKILLSTKIADQKKSGCDDEVKETSDRVGSEKKAEDGNHAMLPLLSYPVQPLAPPPSARSEYTSAITSAEEQYSSFWAHLQAMYKEAGAKFRVHSPEEERGNKSAKMRSGEFVARPGLLQYSLSRKGVEVVEDTSQLERVEGKGTSSFKCVPSVLVHDCPSPFTLNRHIKETWTNSVRGLGQSDSELFSPIPSGKSRTTSSSSTDSERESVESQESNSSRSSTSKNKDKQSVKFPISLPADGTESIIRCVVREKKSLLNESKTNPSPSPQPKRKKKPFKSKTSITSSNIPVVKTKTSQTIEIEKKSQNSADEKKCVENGTMKIDPVEQNTPSSATKYKGKSFKGIIQRARARNEFNKRKRINCNVPVKILNTSITQAKDSLTCLKTRELTLNVKDRASRKVSYESKDDVHISAQIDVENLKESNQISRPADESSKQRMGTSGDKLPNQRERGCSRRSVAKIRKKSCTRNRGKSVDRASSPIIINFLSDANYGSESTCLWSAKEMSDTATSMDLKKGVNRSQQTVPVVNLQYPEYPALLKDSEKPSLVKIDSLSNSRPNPWSSKFQQRRGIMRSNACFPDNKGKRNQVTNNLQPKPINRCIIRTSAGRQRAFKSASEFVKKAPQLPQKCSKSSIESNECSMKNSASRLTIKKQVSFADHAFMKGENRNNTKNLSSSFVTHSNENTNNLDQKISRTITSSTNKENNNIFSTRSNAEPKFYGSENITRKAVSENPSFYSVNTCLIGKNYNDNGWLEATNYGSVGTSHRPSQKHQHSRPQTGHTSLYKLLDHCSSADSGVSCCFYSPQTYPTPSNGCKATTQQYDVKTPFNAIPYSHMSHPWSQYVTHSSGELENRQHNYASYCGYRDFNGVSSNKPQNNHPLFMPPSLHNTATLTSASFHHSSCPSLATEGRNPPMVSWPVNSTNSYYMRHR